MMIPGNSCVTFFDIRNLSLISGKILHLINIALDVIVKIGGLSTLYPSVCSEECTVD